MAPTEIRERRRTLRYRNLLVRQTVQMKNKISMLNAVKKLERLRAFLRFCERRKWIDHNPALDLKAPKIHNKPTMPFTHMDMVKILAAFEKYGKRAGVSPMRSD